MRYYEILTHPAWRTKRQEIFERDRWRCGNCKHFQRTFLLESTNDDELSKFIPREDWLILHAHHKCYRLNKYPWEQPNKDLITLCEKCHTFLHDIEPIIVLDENNNKVDTLEICYRCNGKGYLPQYRHVQNGICFRCRGLKRIPKHLNHSLKDIEVTVDPLQVANNIYIDSISIDELYDYIRKNLNLESFVLFLARVYGLQCNT